MRFYPYGQNGLEATGPESLALRIFVLHKSNLHSLDLQSQHSRKVTAECKIAPEEPETRMAASPARRLAVPYSPWI